ncbi:MAG TPA: choice-of-anchor V domain-containing protein [Blastocatellia bacterium]|nr:choice-of-anchor V domain-containing protein [Blastocatellia bacterium]
MDLSAKRRIQAAILLLLSSAIAYASVFGPEPGYTGAPGDLGNCTACHDQHSVNSGPGSVKLNGLPSIYEPGKAYTLLVTAAQAGRIRFGFQLTVIDASRKRAGTLTSLDGTTQVLTQTGPGGRQYIEHTQLGADSPFTGSRTWQIRWTAPDTDVGTVVFYFAGNATNASGRQDDDDYIYTNSAFLDSATGGVTVTLVSNPGGQTLAAGSKYLIDWSTTGDSNIDNIELRYSTDDGATFPISNLIASITDPSVSSYEWTVPNTPAAKARIRVAVGKKSGDAAVPAISEAFAISGSGGGSAPVPVIFGVSASGKKLFVSGENFMMGAVIEVNGVEKGTNNLEDFSHMLRSKKGAKKIHEGDTVDITVLNPDNTRSAPFSFTRPPE